MNKNIEVEFRIYTIGEMKDWLYSGKQVGLTTDVISNARALAIVRNPYAQDNSPAIVVAYDQNHKAVGYTAVMADRLKGETIFYGTSGFLDASMRGKGVGTQLYATMMNACRNRWLSPDQSPSALAISKKMGLNVYHYNRYYLNFTHTHSFKSLLRAWYVRNINQQVLRHIRVKTRLEILRHIDDVTFSFIRQHSEKALFPRSQEMLNWILQNPFKYCAPADLATYSSYEFTTALPQYVIYAFRIVFDQMLIGFAMFRLNMGELTLLYLFKDDKYDSIIYPALVKHILSQKITYFKTFVKELIDSFNQLGGKSMNVHSRIIPVSLSVPKDIKVDNSLVFQGGDGDMFC